MECAVELRCSAGGVCSAGGFCCVALQCGFAVECEDSEDTGFCPLRIIGCAPEQWNAKRTQYLCDFQTNLFKHWQQFGNRISLFNE